MRLIDWFVQSHHNSEHPDDLNLARTDNFRGRRRVRELLRRAGGDGLQERPRVGQQTQPSYPGHSAAFRQVQHLQVLRGDIEVTV